MLVNISRFGHYLHLIYSTELEVKDTNATQTSDSYLELYLEVDKREED